MTSLNPLHTIEKQIGEILLLHRGLTGAAARVGPQGAATLPQPPLAPELLGLVQHVAAYERLTAAAAVSGDPVEAKKALLAHPLIGQAEYASELAERLLSAGAEHLPQFAREVTA